MFARGWGEGGVRDANGALRVTVALEAENHAGTGISNLFEEDGKQPGMWIW